MRQNSIVSRFIVFFLFVLFASKENNTVFVIGQIATDYSNPHPQPRRVITEFIQQCCQFISSNDNDSKTSTVSEVCNASDSDNSNNKFGFPNNKFIQCVNNSISLNNQKIFDNMYSSGGPSLGLGIVTYATENIYDYFFYEMAVMQTYAEHNHYILKHFTEKSANYEEADCRWNKVKILSEAIDPDNGWGRDLDYVLWIDADVIVLDFSLRVEKIAAEYPEADIIVSAEHTSSTTLINSGTVLVKNTVWSRWFLQQWWDIAERPLFSDQEQFDMAYKAHIQNKNQTHRIKILPADAMNSDPPAMTQQKPHNQVLHLMGENSAYRAKVFGTAFDNVCHHLHRFADGAQRELQSSDGTASATELVAAVNPQPLMHQLGITRERLLTWTIEIYSEIVENDLESFEMIAHEGGHAVKKARAFANDIHHIAHAIIGSKSIQADLYKTLFNISLFKRLKLSADHSVAEYQLRKLSYDMLSLNLRKRRLINQNHRRQFGKILTEWPEHLKAVAEAGQNLGQFGSNEQRKLVFSEVEDLLDEMLSVCHKQQQSAVLMMKGYMKQHLGMIAISENNFVQAFIEFKAAVNIIQPLTKIFGEHLLVSPLTQYANVLAATRRYTEADKVFKKAILLTTQHVGSEHISVIQLSVNYGIMLTETGHYSRAIQILSRAHQILDKSLNMGIFIQGSDIFMQKITQYIQIAKSNL